jgi:hypothetical protein
LHWKAVLESFVFFLLIHWGLSVVSALACACVQVFKIWIFHCCMPGQTIEEEEEEESLLP